MPGGIRSCCCAALLDLCSLPTFRFRSDLLMSPSCPLRLTYLFNPSAPYIRTSPPFFPLSRGTQMRRSYPLFPTPYFVSLATPPHSILLPPPFASVIFVDSLASQPRHCACVLNMTDAHSKCLMTTLVINIYGVDLAPPDACSNADNCIIPLRVVVHTGMLHGIVLQGQGVCTMRRSEVRHLTVIAEHGYR